MNPSSVLWDLVVVGAGPAGSATALAALHRAPDLRVLLLDRADFPRDKSCGDGIAPHVLDVLGTVGVHGLLDDRVPLRRLSISLGAHAAHGPLSRPVWVVPRTELDARLVARAEDAGAQRERRRVRTLEVRPGDVLVDGEHRARVVVGADGAYSVVRRGVLGGTTGRRALAIRGYTPTPPAFAGRQVIRYGDRRMPSYAWCFDRGDGLANVGYGELVDGSDDLTRELLLGELDRLLPGTVPDGHAWRAHHLPLSGLPRRHAAGPVLLTGDAAHLVNPMTGEGIYYAVATGVLAGHAAADALAAGRPGTAGTAYTRAVRRLLSRHQRHTTLTARLSAVPRVVAAGIDAAARHQAVFDDLVEIGLGRGTITPRLVGGLARALARPGPHAHPTDVETSWRS
jgi:geranylgeranyl reductase family protein